MVRSLGGGRESAAFSALLARRLLLVAGVMPLGRLLFGLPLLLGLLLVVALMGLNRGFALGAMIAVGDGLPPGLNGF